MSSNPNRKKSAVPDQQRRMTSITRRIHWYMIRGKLLRFLFGDLLLAALLCVGWALDQEYTKFGAILPDCSRTLEGMKTAAEPGADILYLVTNPDGRVLLSVSCLVPLTAIGIILAVILGLQLLGQILSYFREDRAIRRILAPINEIALRADELSRLSFTEDKYQVIEDALEHINPGEDGPLSFGDTDLMGVEAAMNNLLLRTRDTIRQQNRFVNDASHELRTPIAVIQGYASMLDRWGKNDEKILEAIKAAGFEPGKDFTIAMDAAASEWKSPKGKGYYKQPKSGKEFTSDELIAHWESLVDKYPIISIEDGLDEEDWEGWQRMTAKIGSKVQLVGDDLFVTNTERLSKGIALGAANSILIKPRELLSARRIQS